MAVCKNDISCVLTYPPSATDEERLQEIFTKFGAVTEVFIPKDSILSRHLGFGFVVYSSCDGICQNQMDELTISVEYFFECSNVKLIDLFKGSKQTITDISLPGPNSNDELRVFTLALGGCFGRATFPKGQ